MIRYVIKRVLILIPVLLGIAFIVLGLMSLTPSSPGEAMLGPKATEEQIAAFNHKVGYDRPFMVKYFTFLKDLIIHGDLGTSYRTGIPVSEEISRCLPITFNLALFAMIVAAGIGIPLGVLSAVKQYSLMDTLPTFGALIFTSIPTFWLGMVIMYLFAYKLAIFPIYGVDSLAGYVLPTVMLCTVQAPRIMRFTRSSMLDTIRADYIRTARAKGIAERTVIWKHALKNGLLPVATVMGNTFGLQLGGAFVTESLFNIPGLGKLILVSVAQRDIPVIIGSAVVFAFLYNIVLLIVDILYAFIDPRIKAKYSKLGGALYAKKKKSQHSISY